MNRSLVFVGHSLGGLVIKQALIKSAEYNSNNRHLNLAEIYQATEGVIFLGTPHRGSDKAELADVIANAARVLWTRPNRQLITVLKQDSDTLEN